MASAAKRGGENRNGVSASSAGWRNEKRRQWRNENESALENKLSESNTQQYAGGAIEEESGIGGESGSG